MDEQEARRDYELRQRVSASPAGMVGAVLGIGILVVSVGYSVLGLIFGG